MPGAGCGAAVVKSCTQDKLVPTHLGKCGRLLQGEAHECLEDRDKDCPASNACSVCQAADLRSWSRHARKLRSAHGS
eukprot:67506-Chlamydomonas_euryale.AAC.15